MEKILEKIIKPQDLKKLNLSELEKLSNELREEIIKVCSNSGGHLAASLGCVELIIALHRVFNTPEDKIIFDVGHQCYAHKLLTGRKDKFQSLRQYQGISGFPQREESEYDAFNTGHGSTSISAALGMALARDLEGRKENIIAVIGDGGLSGGMAFEALNHAGHLKTDLIVILNDNEMFISPKVGALSNYLSKLRVASFYISAREDFERIVGRRIFRLTKRVKDLLKYLLMPGVIFEELGFNYMGPVDGHNLEILEKTLNFAKKMKGPIFIHTLTKKGKGYTPAENDATKFHGIGSFDTDTGEIYKVSDVPTYTEIFGETLVELAKENKKIVAITAAMKEGTGLSEFSKKYPERFFDVGMAEQHAVTFAAGLACSGFKPFVAIYSTFLQRSYDQILHDVCLQKLPVVFTIDRAGIVGEDGPTHQGIFDLSYLRHIPNLVIMSPKDEEELRNMLYSALEYDMPVAIRYPKGSAIGVKRGNLKKISIGIAELLKEGKDLFIIAIGRMVYPSMIAAEELEKENISIGVINVRFVKPLDENLILELSKKVNKILTVEENVLQGGFGSAILEFISSKNIDIKISSLGLPDNFIESGSVEILHKKYGLDKEGIKNKIREILKE